MTKEWEKHPQYLADVGGLFGAPPQLKCRYCGKTDHELFYGHCRECASEKGVPMKVAETREFHRAVEKGVPIVVSLSRRERFQMAWKENGVFFLVASAICGTVFALFIYIAWVFHTFPPQP